MIILEQGAQKGHPGPSILKHFNTRFSFLSAATAIKGNITFTEMKSDISQGLILCKRGRQPP